MTVLDIHGVPYPIIQWCRGNLSEAPGCYCGTQRLSKNGAGYIALDISFVKYALGIVASWCWDMAEGCADRDYLECPSKISAGRHGTFWYR